jgi:hypothetical protein
MVLKADVGKVHVTVKYLTRVGAHRVLDAIDAGIKSGQLVGVSANVWAPMEMQGKPGHPWFVTVLGEDPVIIERAEKIMLETKNSQRLGRDTAPADVLKAMREKRWRAIREHQGRGFQQRDPQPTREDGAFINKDGSVEYLDSVPA